MRTYRMKISATICFDVQADSETDALTKAEQVAQDFDSGFDLPGGDGYSDAVLYTSTEDHPDVMDITEEEPS